MTTLLLVQRKIGTLRPSFSLAVAEETFARFNRGGVLTASFLLVLIASAGIYLGSLYTSFYFGFGMGAQQKHIVELGKNVAEIELSLQEKRDRLAYDQTAIVESMEKVSSIKYLTSDSVAISESIVLP